MLYRHPISKDGFSYANKLQIGNTKDKSKELIFGDKRINVNPQAAGLLSFFVKFFEMIILAFKLQIKEK